MIEALQKQLIKLKKYEIQLGSKDLEEIRKNVRSFMNDDFAPYYKIGTLYAEFHFSQ